MLIIAEGVVADVDPEFRFAEALAPYARRHLLSGLTAADVRRRLEQFGIDLAELTAELPSRLYRISEAIETGGLEIHLRTDEMDALLARVERLGNRVAASVLTAALIEGVVQLATWRRRHRPWPRRGRRTASAKLGRSCSPHGDVDKAKRLTTRDGAPPAARAGGNRVSKMQDHGALARKQSLVTADRNAPRATRLESSQHGRGGVVPDVLWRATSVQHP